MGASKEPQNAVMAVCITSFLLVWGNLGSYRDTPPPPPTEVCLDDDLSRKSALAQLLWMSFHPFCITTCEKLNTAATKDLLQRMADVCKAAGMY